jgi:hypothetical protein
MAGHPSFISSYLSRENVHEDDINILLSSAFTRENYKSNDVLKMYTIKYDTKFSLQDAESNVSISSAFLKELDSLKESKGKKKAEKEEREKNLLSLTDLPKLMELIEVRRTALQGGTLFSSQDMKKKDKDREKGMRNKSNLIRDKAYFDRLLSTVDDSLVYRVDNCSVNGTGCNKSKIPTKGILKRLGDKDTPLYNAGFMYKAKLDKAYMGALNFLRLYIGNEDEAKASLSSLVSDFTNKRKDTTV